MAINPNCISTGDQRLVTDIVNNIKSRGVFDEIRKECLADVDTKPAYQNLRQRVENYVAKYLAKQTGSPKLNKNQLRNELRKEIDNSGMLSSGVDRIIEQVVNPKVYKEFKPVIETIICQHLDIDVQQRQERERKQMEILQQIQNRGFSQPPPGFPVTKQDTPTSQQAPPIQHSTTVPPPITDMQQYGTTHMMPPQQAPRTSYPQIPAVTMVPQQMPYAMMPQMQGMQMNPYPAMSNDGRLPQNSVPPGMPPMTMALQSMMTQHQYQQQLMLNQQTLLQQHQAALSEIAKYASIGGHSATTATSGTSTINTYPTASVATSTASTASTEASQQVPVASPTLVKTTSSPPPLPKISPASVKKIPLPPPDEASNSSRSVSPEVYPPGTTPPRPARSQSCSPRVPSPESMDLSSDDSPPPDIRSDDDDDAPLQIDMAFDPSASFLTLLASPRGAGLLETKHDDKDDGGQITMETRGSSSEKDEVQSTSDDSSGRHKTLSNPGKTVLSSKSKKVSFSDPSSRKVTFSDGDKGKQKNETKKSLSSKNSAADNSRTSSDSKSKSSSDRPKSSLLDKAKSSSDKLSTSSSVKSQSSDTKKSLTDTKSKSSSSDKLKISSSSKYRSDQHRRDDKRSDSRPDKYKSSGVKQSSISSSDKSRSSSTSASSTAVQKYDKDGRRIPSIPSSSHGKPSDKSASSKKHSSTSSDKRAFDKHGSSDRLGSSERTKHSSNANEPATGSATKSNIKPGEKPSVVRVPADGGARVGDDEHRIEVLRGELDIKEIKDEVKEFKEIKDERRRVKEEDDEEPKKYTFAWDNLEEESSSDSDVSSVHTSDLSSNYEISDFEIEEEEVKEVKEMKEGEEVKEGEEKPIPVVKTKLKKTKEQRKQELHELKLLTRINLRRERKQNQRYGNDFKSYLNMNTDDSFSLTESEDESEKTRKRKRKEEDEGARSVTPTDEPAKKRIKIKNEIGKARKLVKREKLVITVRLPPVDSVSAEAPLFRTRKYRRTCIASGRRPQHFDVDGQNFLLSQRSPLTNPPHKRRGPKKPPGGVAGPVLSKSWPFVLNDARIGPDQMISGAVQTSVSCRAMETEPDGSGSGSDADSVVVGAQDLYKLARTGVTGSEGGTVTVGEAASVTDSEGSTVPGSEGGTVPGSEGGTVPGSEGGTVPGSKGGTVPGSKGVSATGSEGAALTPSMKGSEERKVVSDSENNIDTFSNVASAAETLIMLATTSAGDEVKTLDEREGEVEAETRDDDKPELDKNIKTEDVIGDFVQMDDSVSDSDKLPMATSNSLLNDDSLNFPISVSSSMSDSGVVSGVLTDAPNRGLLPVEALVTEITENREVSDVVHERSVSITSASIGQGGELNDKQDVVADMLEDEAGDQVVPENAAAGAGCLLDDDSDGQRCLLVSSTGTEGEDTSSVDDGMTSQHHRTEQEAETTVPLTLNMAANQLDQLKQSLIIPKSLMPCTDTVHLSPAMIESPVVESLPRLGPPSPDVALNVSPQGLMMPHVGSVSPTAHEPPSPTYTVTSTSPKAGSLRGVSPEDASSRPETIKRMRRPSRRVVEANVGQGHTSLRKRTDSKNSDITETDAKSDTLVPTIFIDDTRRRTNSDTQSETCSSGRKTPETERVGQGRTVRARKVSGTPSDSRSSGRRSPDTSRSSTDTSDRSNSPTRRTSRRHVEPKRVWSPEPDTPRNKRRLASNSGPAPKRTK